MSNLIECVILLKIGKHRNLGNFMRKYEMVVEFIVCSSYEESYVNFSLKASFDLFELKYLVTDADVRNEPL